MKKFPTIEIKELPVENEIVAEEPEPETLESQSNLVVGGKTPLKPKEDNIFVKKEKETKLVKEGKVRSAKQLAHLENIRAKALIARQNKAKAKKDFNKVSQIPSPVIVEQPTLESQANPEPIKQQPEPIKQQPTINTGELGVVPQLYTKSQMDEYAKGALINYHTETRDKRIAEVRKKQAELEEQRKKYDVSPLLKKGGKSRMW